MSEEPVSVAIVGLGTVGTGVAGVLAAQPEAIARRAGRPIALRHAVVRDLKKTRGITLPPGLVTDDLSRVVRDSAVQVAVHLVGGIHPAREILLELLAAG